MYLLPSSHEHYYIELESLMSRNWEARWHFQSLTEKQGKHEQTKMREDEKEYERIERRRYCFVYIIYICIICIMYKAFSF